MRTIIILFIITSIIFGLSFHGSFGSNAPDDQTIWSTIAPNLKLNTNTSSSRVNKQIRLILADRANFVRILNASQPYIYYIYTQTQQQKLPAELALIPIIESEYSPYNRTGNASGLWQLMPELARIFKIKTRNGYDGRRNVVASTKAALGFYRDLGVKFKGNWLLAIAAYNCGQNAVSNAVRRAGSTNFWNLHLPTETKIYVPRLLAIAAIIKNPQKYGIVLPHIENKPYFTQMQLKNSMSLAQASKKLSANTKTLTALNPDYRNRTIPKNTQVLIPVA